MSLRQFCVTLGLAFGAASLIFAELKNASTRDTLAAAVGAAAVVLLIGAGMSGPRPGR